MSAPIIKKQVLNCFKKLHRTRISVFKDDLPALQAARNKINEEFKKNRHVIDQAAINELLLHSQAVETEMRTSIVQAREVNPGTYELRITPETNKLTNVPFRDCPS